MVHTGNPQGVVALHPLKTDDAVLQGGVHSVAHVQLAGDVGGRHDDGKGLFVLIPLRVEVTALLPHFVNLGFHGLGVVDLVQFFCHCVLLSMKNALGAHTPRAKNVPRYHLNFRQKPDTLAL